MFSVYRDGHLFGVHVGQSIRWDFLCVGTHALQGLFVELLNRGLQGGHLFQWVCVARERKCAYILSQFFSLCMRGYSDLPFERGWVSVDSCGW